MRNLLTITWPFPLIGLKHISSLHWRWYPCGDPPSYRYEKHQKLCFKLWSADGPRTAACRANARLYSLITSKKGQSEVVWRRCRGWERGKGEHRRKRGKCKGKRGRERVRRKSEGIKEGGRDGENDWINLFTKSMK